MDLIQQKWLTYLGLTLLLLFFMIGFPIMGFDLFIVAVLIIAMVIYLTFILSKGNISQYDLENMKLIWKDEVIKKPMTTGTLLRRVKISGVVLLALGVILALVSPKIFSIIGLQIRQGAIDSTAVYLIMISVFLTMGFLGAFLFCIGGLIRYTLRQKGRLTEKYITLYSEGVKYRNYFIEWNNIKSISYPGSFNDSHSTLMMITRFFSRGDSATDAILGGAGSGTFSKIIDINDKVYLVEIINKKGFEDALLQLNKQDLIK